MPIETDMYKPQPQPSALEMIGKAYGAANAATQLQASQFDLQKRRFEQLNGILGSLAGDPELSYDKAREAVIYSVQQGVIPPQMAQQALGSLRALPPEKMRGQLQNWLVNSIDGMSRLQASTGAPTLQNNGDVQQWVNVNAARGTVQPMGGSGAAMPNKLSPQDRISPQPTFQNGQPGTYPTGTRFDNRGNLLPAQPQAPAAPQSTTPQAGAVNPTGPALGVAETVRANTEREGQLTAAADGSYGRRAILNNLEADLGKFEPGPMAEKINKVKSVVNQAAGIVGAKPVFDTEVVAAQESFRKNAEMLIQQQQAALGGTDAAKASAGRSNPNEGYSPAGNQKLIATLKGNEDAIAVRAQEWLKWRETHGPGTVDKFDQEFNKKFSPRAFQWSYMSPENKASMWKSMSPQERESLKASSDAAIKNGWIKPNTELAK